MDLSNKVFGSNVDPKIRKYFEDLQKGSFTAEPNESLVKPGNVVSMPDYTTYLGDRNPYARMWTAVNISEPNKEDKGENKVFVINENGEVIDDIASYLSNHHAANPLQPSFDYYAYVYKKQPGKDGKSYTEVYPRLVPNTDNGRKELEGYIGFLKTKNLIKEFDGELPKNGTAPTANAGTPTQF